MSSLNERRREMSILRAVGARPWDVLLLLISESALLAASGALLGLGMIIGLILFFGFFTVLGYKNIIFFLFLFDTAFDWLCMLSFGHGMLSIYPELYQIKSNRF